jgi:AraC family transcriptional regulator
MNIGVRFIQPKGYLALEACDSSDKASDVYVLLCRADSTICVPAGLLGCWWPIRGTATLSTCEYAVCPNSREAYVSDAQRALDVAVDSESVVLGIVAAPRTWNTLLAARNTHLDTTQSILSPVLHRLPATLRRHLLPLVRLALLAPQQGDARCLFAAISVIQKVQEKYSVLMERCPGRSRSQRRSVFARLQRVRNLLSFSTDSELDMRQVAAAANYSLWRFIRVFALVFGETPYAYVSRCRIDRARRMLIGGSVAVGDVAVAVGYETGVALSRAIRRRFGVPASQLRLSERERALPCP